MATIDNGYLGGFVGKLGTAVGYCWRGRWCVRSLARPSNPRTEAQQAHRSLFKQEVQLAGRMNWVLRRTMESVSLAEGMTPCNYFVHRNQPSFSLVEGALRVDWSALVLSEGPVAPVAFGTPAVSGGTTLEVPYEKNPERRTANAYDRVYLYVYVPELEEGYLAAPAYRRDGRVAVALPGRFAGREVQLWGMVEDQAGRWSQTLYIGYGPLEDTPAAAPAADAASEAGRAWVDMVAEVVVNQAHAPVTGAHGAGGGGHG